MIRLGDHFEQRGGPYIRKKRSGNRRERITIDPPREPVPYRTCCSGLELMLVFPDEREDKQFS
jgi:hypothetical protein